MNRKLAWILVFSLSLVAIGHGQTAGAAAAHQTLVDCNRGQSINTALSKIDKHTPATILVKGTCTEWVQIIGFEDLTLKGSPGATLVLPSTNPQPNLLLIEGSRNLVIDGFSMNSNASGPAAIGVLNGGTDVRLRNLTIDGGNPGIIVGGNNWVSIDSVTIKNSGYAAVGVYAESSVTIHSCLFENTTGTPWHEGLNVGGAYVSIEGTTIRNMQTSLHANGSGIIDVGGGTDVIVDNPAGTNFYGAVIEGGSSLNVGSAKLRITNAGQPYGGDTGGIKVSAGSSLWVSANLIISGSQGQGIYVTGNSHATLNGSSITGSQHGGLVAVNLSTISTVTWDQPVTVSGNAVDVFCDSQSVITGGVKIVNTSSVQCPNLLPGDSVPIP
jgi:hypothetical protein